MNPVANIRLTGAVIVAAAAVFIAHNSFIKAGESALSEEIERETERERESGD